jgi:hypothetical protein
MQQFTVPQFIDVEDKIFGPLTTRQFLIMLAGFLIVAVSYKLLTFVWFLIILVTVFCSFGMLAFFKVNGMPMHFFILNFIETNKSPSLRVWNNSYHMSELVDNDDEIEQHVIEASQQKSYTTSRLNELSLIVDTKGVYMGEERPEEDKKIKRIDI